MLGLFDSGSGGLNTVRYVKENAPDVDLVYLIDREHAPYGIKTEKEIVSITEENIERLTKMGAERVLIACCTASTVHGLLDKRLGDISIPIIDEVARAAKASTYSGRIGVIATAHTVRAHAFKSALNGCEVAEVALGELVGMIDGGLSDKTVTSSDEERIERMLRPILASSPDTLILGCTHFPALIKTIEKLTRPHGINSIIDSARIGAEILINESRKIIK